MFRKSAAFYDAVYSGKDYAAEATHLVTIIRHFVPQGANSLLDVACGTGAHLEHLQKEFVVTGLDVDEDMVRIARVRLPGVAIHHADMTDFALPQSFDAIVCLFSAIGYTRTIHQLLAAVSSMAAHLTPGGVLCIEPWFTPQQWITGGLHALHVDQPGTELDKGQAGGLRGLRQEAGRREPGDAVGLENPGLSRGVDDEVDPQHVLRPDQLEDVFGHGLRLALDRCANVARRAVVAGVSTPVVSNLDVVAMTG